MDTPTRPQYAIIASALRERIESMGPNTILPSEPVLARQFGVSRVTIRQALDVLQRSGKISRQRGRGTIVNPQKVTRHLLPLQRIEDDFARQGVYMETLVDTFELSCVPPPDIAAAIGLKRKEKVGFISMSRSIDGRVVCDDRRYFPEEISSNINPDIVSTIPVAVQIRRIVNRPVTSINWQTDISGAEAKVAGVLGVTEGTQIVTNTAVEFLSDGKWVEASCISYRLDRVKFVFAISSDAPIFPDEDANP